MDATTVQTALQFGGSPRFNDRSGPGRFGMGLPNSSVSQARRVEVFTWTKPNHVFTCYLDVDEIATGKLKYIPAPTIADDVPELISPYLKSKSGTIVLWTRCDKTDSKKAITIAANMHVPLGRMFRYYIWDGVQISINHERVKAIDPLYLHPKSPNHGTLFQETLEYPYRVPSEPSKTSIIKVRFSELPVQDWHNLSVEEKRSRGIVKGAGVSIVRAKREIDYGWYFMGVKRKENYDDWWRCEISFEPDLDECFGVTHSKQEVNPTIDLNECLSKDLEMIAHALNNRARTAYVLVKATGEKTTADIISEKDSLLPPIPQRDEGNIKRKISGRGSLKYRIIVQSMPDSDFYCCDVKNGMLTL